MAIKRFVTMTCDGPCGTVLEGVSSVPKDWYTVKKNLSNQGPTEQGRYDIASLCPRCTKLLTDLFDVHGFSFVKVDKQNQQAKE